jgi:hypothetical protein
MTPMDMSPWTWLCHADLNIASCVNYLDDFSEKQDFAQKLKAIFKAFDASLLLQLSSALGIRAVLSEWKLGQQNCRLHLVNALHGYPICVYGYGILLKPKTDEFQKFNM